MPWLEDGATNWTSSIVTFWVLTLTPLTSVLRKPFVLQAACATGQEPNLAMKQTCSACANSLIPAQNAANAKKATPLTPKPSSARLFQLVKTKEVVRTAVGMGLALKMV